MSDDIFFYQHEEIKYIWTIVISNPGKRNTLTPNILSKISDFLKDPDVRETARAIIIRGDGEKSFSAGYDISQIRNAGDQDAGKASAAVMYRTLNDIKEFPAPVISMISGFCIGAGCHLAAVTDIRIASEDLKMGITPVKIGLLYHPDGILDFFNLIGQANTRELFYTGQLYTAEEAKAMGLVSRVVPRENLEDAVCSLARQISENAPLSVSGTKYTVNRIVEAFALNSEVREKIIKLREEAFDSNDIKEGRLAFAEKRKPVFQGK